MNKKLQCVETKIIKEPGQLINTIYNNFLYLVEYPVLMHNKDEIRRIITATNCMNYLVFHGGKLVAYLIGDFRTLDDNRYAYYISYIYVTRKFRNRKIGSKLMKKLIIRCLEKGVKFIVLTCDSDDPINMAFYRKFGFKPDPLLSKGGRQDVLTLFLSDVYPYN